jgi:hypothetical protein
MIPNAHRKFLFSSQIVVFGAQFAKSFKSVSIFIVLIHKQEATLFVQDAIPSPSALCAVTSPEGEVLCVLSGTTKAPPFGGAVERSETERVVIFLWAGASAPAP